MNVNSLLAEIVLEKKKFDQMVLATEIS